MRVICIIQARLGSTRLPGKVLAILDGHTVLDWCVRACKAAVGIDEVWVATTLRSEDDRIVDWCEANNRPYARGSAEDVLSRFVITWEKALRPDVILRVTADEPFIDPYVISLVVRKQRETGADYCSNIHPRTFADGMDVECFTRKALMAAYSEATQPIDRDTVTYWMVRNAHRFSPETVINPIPAQSGERYVLDTPEDMKFCQAIVAWWPWEKGPPSQLDILNVLDKDPGIRKLNKGHIMNERFYQSLVEAPFKRDYSCSRALLNRARKTVPLGAQTFSKSHIQYPEQAPLFVTHGNGGEVFDVDGNGYIDLVAGLLPVILGHHDPDVDDAIRRQLDRGISFSLATDLEFQLAERLCRLIPCAEMVRFGKTGSDVTSAAVRLARAYTGRDLIMSSGYHGWHDWTVAGDDMRWRGVPDDLFWHVEKLDYGNINEMQERCIRDKAYAAVIVEPETNPVFLRRLRELCDETKTILIFDEVITGFRWALGGAQQYFQITPDLACFGKAMGNGMPISAIVGKREIMQLMEPPNNIFYSGTFFGEALSLAAAIATIDKLEREKVPQLLHSKATKLMFQISAAVDDDDAGIEFPMQTPLTRLKFASNDIKTLYMQEMIANGVLVIASHNLMYAHTENDMQRVVNAYKRTFEVLSMAKRKNDVRERIRGSAIPTNANVRAAE